MKKMTDKRYYCKVCKELAEKDHKKGVVGKYLLRSMLAFDTEEEAIEHLKKEHKITGEENG